MYRERDRSFRRTQKEKRAISRTDRERDGDRHQRWVALRMAEVDAEIEEVIETLPYSGNKTDPASIHEGEQL